MAVTLPTNLAAQVADIAVRVPRTALVEVIKSQLPRRRATTKPQSITYYSYRIGSGYVGELNTKAEIEKIIKTLPKFTDAKRQTSVEWKGAPNRWVPDKKLRTKKPKGT